MSEMIERVALAISGSNDPANILTIHRDRAKAAIEAMREPTKAMVSAGYDEADGSHLWREVWKAMIDEALK